MRCDSVRDVLLRKKWLLFCFVQITPKIQKKAFFLRRTSLSQCGRLLGPKVLDLVQSLLSRPAADKQVQKASIKQKASHLCTNQTLRVWKKHSFWKSDDNMNSSNGHNIMTLQSNDQQHADKQVQKASCMDSNKTCVWKNILIGNQMAI